MIVLAIECSTTAGGVAVLSETKLIGTVGFDTATLYSQRLLPSLEWLMARCELDPSAISGLAVSIGPGSFTGLRIGLSAAKALAYSWNRPVVGIGTMEALALRAATGAGSQARVCTILDARQGEVFAGLYDVNAHDTRVTKLHEVHAGSLDALSGWIDRSTIFAGDAALKHAQRLIELFAERHVPASAMRNLPSAEEIALLGMKRLQAGQADDLMLLEPEYLRRSYTGA